MIKNKAHNVVRKRNSDNYVKGTSSEINTE